MRRTCRRIDSGMEGQGKKKKRKKREFREFRVLHTKLGGKESCCRF